MAFVTIGLPFYNAEKTLADAIRSVFAQTHQDWELILVDDGSTDRSLEIARSVNDPRVRVISDGKNLKLAARLNQIVREAKYDFIARMDADDLMSPTRIEEELKVFKECPDIDLVSTGVCSLSERNIPQGIRCHNNTIMTPYECITHKNGAGIVHASIIAKKSWYLRNLYDTTFSTSQDAELWIRASSKKDFSHYIIRKPLYYYKELGNITPNKLVRGTENLILILKKYQSIIPFFPERLRCWQILLTKRYILKILVMTGQLQRLLSIRNKKIENKESYTEFLSEIKEILQTQVPGIDPVSLS